MRALIRSALLAAFLAAPLAAQEAPEAAIRSVIERQVAAFRAGDLATAFSFASPDIQHMFGTPDRFGTMVRSGYPMVWHPADLRFLGLSETDGVVWQLVLVKDDAGVWHKLAYRMEPDGQGGWRIGGVEILHAPQSGA